MLEYVQCAKDAKCEKFEKYGKIAVLVTTQYGCPWSEGRGVIKAIDKRIIEFYLKIKSWEKYLGFLTCSQMEKAWKEFFRKEFDEQDEYVRGYEDGLQIRFVDKNANFEITNYDGLETIEFIE